MKINNKEVKTNGFFAYDGCHKIYILEDEEDYQEASKTSYDILSIKKLEDVYEASCPLKFINNWKLTTIYAPQCEDAKFEY